MDMIYKDYLIWVWGFAPIRRREEIGTILGFPIVGHARKRGDRKPIRGSL
jgi:hypothetical protein